MKMVYSCNLQKDKNHY